MSCAKTAQPIEMPFQWGINTGALKEACVRWGHIGPSDGLNHPYVAAMLVFVKLL